MTTRKDHNEEAAAKGDVQKQVDDAQAKGYLGVKVDLRDNSEYSLESGPDSPPAVEDDQTPVTQVTRAKEA